MGTLCCVTSPKPQLISPARFLEGSVIRFVVSLSLSLALSLATRCRSCSLCFACSLGLGSCLWYCCKPTIPPASLRRLSCVAWTSRPRQHGRRGWCWVIGRWYLLHPTWCRTLQRHTKTLTPRALDILGKHETTYCFIPAVNCNHQQ